MVNDMPRSILRNVFAPLPQAVLFALLLTLAGCGNKGPLYLPSSPEPRAGTESAPAPAPTMQPSATPDNQ